MVGFKKKNRPFEIESLNLSTKQQIKPTKMLVTGEG